LQLWLLLLICVLVMLFLELTLCLVQHVLITAIWTASDVPTTTGGKAFTVFYVPLSVVMVAAAIQRVANIPLKNRQSALEDHVLSEFGKSISKCVTHLKCHCSMQPFRTQSTCKASVCAATAVLTLSLHCAERILIKSDARLD
jgi:hypothetical protein